ncbi:helix-turn-helix domain-containing protein [Microbacterium aerolatum]|uniref:helix-turn-helix domain-containing protein n=1 Tax=Microbacterium aerolatum TaxID=153731 RepID=UPI00384D33AC
MPTREECLTALADYILEVFEESAAAAARRAVTKAQSELRRDVPLPTTGPTSAGNALLKISEAAERMGVSRHWIYRRIESGEIPVVELGDSRKNQRIRESDLDSFIAARTYGADRSS